MVESSGHLGAFDAEVIIARLHQDRRELEGITSVGCSGEVRLQLGELSDPNDQDVSDPR